MPQMAIQGNTLQSLNEVDERALEFRRDADRLPLLVVLYTRQRGKRSAHHIVLRPKPRSTRGPQGAAVTLSDHWADRDQLGLDQAVRIEAVACVHARDEPRCPAAASTAATSWSLSAMFCSSRSKVLAVGSKPMTSAPHSDARSSTCLRWPDVTEVATAAQCLPPDRHVGPVGVQDPRGSGPMQVDPGPEALLESGDRPAAQQPGSGGALSPDPPSAGELPLDVIGSCLPYEYKPFPNANSRHALRQQPPPSRSPVSISLEPRPSLGSSKRKRFRYSGFTFQRPPTVGDTQPKHRGPANGQYERRNPVLANFY